MAFATTKGALHGAQSQSLRAESRFIIRPSGGEMQMQDFVYRLLSSATLTPRSATFPTRFVGQGRGCATKTQFRHSPMHG